MKYKQVDKLKSVTGNDSQSFNIPNQETLDAIAETLGGELIAFDNMEEFFKDLDI